MQFNSLSLTRTEIKIRHSFKNKLHNKTVLPTYRSRFYLNGYSQTILFPMYLNGRSVSPEGLGRYWSKSNYIFYESTENFIGPPNKTFAYTILCMGSSDSSINTWNFPGLMTWFFMYFDNSRWGVGFDVKWLCMNETLTLLWQNGPYLPSIKDRDVSVLWFYFLILLFVDDCELVLKENKFYCYEKKNNVKVEMEPYYLGVVIYPSVKSLYLIAHDSYTAEISTIIFLWKATKCEYIRSSK